MSVLLCTTAPEDVCKALKDARTQCQKQAPGPTQLAVVWSACNLWCCLWHITLPSPLSGLTAGSGRRWRMHWGRHASRCSCL